MSTLQRKQASQKNGALSQGPITSEGKQRSAQNAIRHGLLSKTIVLADEDPKQFQALLDQYLDELQPATHLQHEAVEEMAAAKWRLRRLHRIEKTIIDKYSDQFGEGTPDQNIAGGFQYQSDTIANLERYEARLNRLYYIAFKHFQELRKLDPPAPAPTQVTQIEPQNPTLGSFGKSQTTPPQPLQKTLAAPVQQTNTPPNNDHYRPTARCLQ